MNLKDPANVLAAAIAATLLVAASACADETGSGTEVDAASAADLGAADADEPCDPSTEPRCAGANAPVYELWDFQPASARFEETYGLDALRGEVTVVALLASWCSFCQSQAEELERMRAELADSGVVVNVVAVNMIDAEETQTNLSDRCTFPLLQDVEAVGAWDLHDGRKDDIAIYDPDGVLVEFIRVSDLPDEVRRLSTDEGFSYLRERVMAAVGN